MLRIVIVDDDPRVRKALRLLLECQANWQVIGDAANGREAIEQVERLKPDLVTMDVNMPDLDGIEATRHIAKAFPELAVLILSQDTEWTRQAFEAGARAYVPKSDVRRLVETVAELSGDPAALSARIG